MFLSLSVQLMMSLVALVRGKQMLMIGSPRPSRRPASAGRAVQGASWARKAGWSWPSRRSISFAKRATAASSADTASANGLATAVAYRPACGLDAALPTCAFGAIRWSPVLGL